MAARCSLDFEEQLRAAGFLHVCGVDEAGRGPLAGPVVAAAVVLPLGFGHSRLNDSKKLSERVRSEIFEELVHDHRVLRSVVEVSPEEIDRLNILRATHEAMRRAVQGLPVEAGHALVDGLPVKPFPCPHTAIVGGDGLSLSIAAASVFAKVSRDRRMLELDAVYPQYGFAKHKGYGTAQHLARLQQYGPSPIHRRSFAPVQQMCLQF